MDTKKIKKLIEPDSIAIVGASSDSMNLGNQVVYSILKSGYQGKVFPVHHRSKQVHGLKAYPSLDSINQPIDLAYIALNPLATVELIEVCGKLGIPSAICISGGFGELGERGKKLEKKLYQFAKENDVETVGPNTLGIINMEKKLNATFSPLDDLISGNVSMLSQSGGIGYSFLSESVNERLGINKWIGVGNRGTLEFSDYLTYLGNDVSTHVIAIYLEGTDKPREFIEVANRVRRKKPVVVYMVGRSNIAREAALTHTGSMASSYKVYSDIFDQFGLLKAQNITELVSKCKALSMAPLPNGSRVAIVTMSSGPSIVAVDELIERGAKIQQFSEKTISNLQKVLKTQDIFFKNPLDIPGVGFNAVKFGEAIDIVLGDPNIDILLPIFSYFEKWRFPTPEIINGFKKYQKPIIACYIGTKKQVEKEIELLHSNNIPVYTNVDCAVLGISALIDYKKIKIEVS